MNAEGVVAVIGLGEVGQPLLSILSAQYECVGVDVRPVKLDDPCSVMHVCYPFQMPDFIGTTVRYVEQYKPQLVIVNSTVAPGTTRSIQSRFPDLKVAYSPIRGKHAKMRADLFHYKKFVGACDSAALEMAVNHFSGAGFRTGTFRSPEIAELSKLLETTYLGILIGWAQEVERFAAQYQGNFEDVNQFVEEIPFLPGHIFPGVIGGHCVMQNIEILRSCVQSEFLSAIRNSNNTKVMESIEVSASAA